MDRASWTPIEEASRLMGVHRTTLLRRCQDELLGRGLARRITTRIGGRPVWHLHASVSPRLVRADAERAPDGTSAVHQRLREASEAQRQEAARKARLVVAFRAWRQTAVSIGRRGYPGFAAAHDGAPSYSSMMEWSARCPASQDLPGCMAALIDTRGRPREGAPTMSQEAWALYCELRLSERQWSAAKCSRTVRSEALERGWAWPSDDTVARIERDRLTPSQLAMQRLGQDRWAKVHQSPIDQDPEAWAAGECWEGDNARLDFFARVEAKGGQWRAVRPLISAWIDRRSRRLMGYTIGERADATTIRRAMLTALKADDVGLPDHVWVDNGKDFDAASMTGRTKSQRRARNRVEVESRDSALYLMLGIECHFARPYNHNGKARIERLFATVHQDHDREYASWCGSDEGDRPDADTLRAALADVMALPTLDQVRERFAQWAQWYNGRRDHRIDDLVLCDGGSTERLSPIEFYQRRLPARRIAPKESLELLWPTMSRAVQVTKRGVAATIAGKVWRWGAGHPALEPLVGTDARVYIAYDDDRLDEVVVYDTQFRFLCHARMNQLLGGAQVSKEDLREAMGIRREQARRAKERPPLVERVLTDVELVARKARERQVAATDARLREAGHLDAAASANIRLVRTPLDGQAARVAKARKAVGSEADAMPHVDEGEQYGDLLLTLAGGPSDGRPTAVGSQSNGPDLDFFSIDLGTPEEDDGGDILATLGGQA